MNELKITSLKFLSIKMIFITIIHVAYIYYNSDFEVKSFEIIEKTLFALNCSGLNYILLGHSIYLTLFLNNNLDGRDSMLA